jgi:uncharacterized phage protein (TIGR02220 family)
MKEQPNYYGIITAEVRYDKNLPANAKLLYSEITALCNKEGYCYATNGYFADLYQVSDRSITFWLQKLAQCGYIDLQIDKNSKGTFRRIYLTRTNLSSIPVSNLTSNPMEANFYTKEYYNNNNTLNNIKEEYKEISISENLDSIEDVKYYFETSQILELLTEKTKAKYKIPKSKSLLLRYGAYKLIKERLEDGSTLEECIKVIESKYNEWKGTEFMRYLIPETIFRKSNFEKYLTQSQIQIENNLSQTQKPLIDDKGNYANTDEGRELFISNIRKRAAEMFRTEREFRENNFGLPNTNANNEPR